MENKTPELTRQEVLQYSRHLMLPEIGMEGQRRLKSSSVLIVGAGGLGSPAALYLAAAGVGRIGIIDSDQVELSNLQRQIVHDMAHLRQPKASSARDHLLRLNPNIEVQAYNEPFTSENALSILAGYDVLVDGSDNFAARYLANDACALSRKPYVYGAVFQFEGQVSVFDAQRGPCYRCIFPAPPPPEMAPTCAEIGVLGVLPGTIGTLQATEALKLLLGIGSPAIGKLVIYDALNLSFDEIQIKKNPSCRLCGDHAEITQLQDYEAFCAGPGHIEPDDQARVIDPRELADRLAHGESIQLVDVRNPVEAQVSRLPGAVSIPYDQIGQHIQDLDPSRMTVLFCRTGVRSQWALLKLHQAGFENIRYLRGGINAWANQVDPSLLVY